MAPRTSWVFFSTAAIRGEELEGDEAGIGGHTSCKQDNGGNVAVDSHP